MRIKCFGISKFQTTHKHSPFCPTLWRKNYFFGPYAVCTLNLSIRQPWNFFPLFSMKSSKQLLEIELVYMNVNIFFFRKDMEVNEAIIDCIYCPFRYNNFYNKVFISTLYISLTSLKSWQYHVGNLYIVGNSQWITLACN